MLVGHVHTRDFGFDGENALHCLLANRQEAAALEMIDLAYEHFDASQLQELYWAQASGSFFHVLPMMYYGGTPLGYAVAFSMKAPIAALLQQARRSDKMRAIVDLNNPKLACGFTGFRPLHVAVANGLKSMYTWLANLPELPELHTFRADRQGRTQLCKKLEYSDLTPMQLAAKLGDHEMFKFVLREKAELMWRWGPVCQYLSLIHI